MPLSTGTAIFCLWLLVTGLMAVHMEVRNVRAGVQIRDLLEEEEVAVERLRLLQLEYHERLRPEQLERELPGEYRTEEGFPDDGRAVFRPPTEDEVVDALAAKDTR